MSFPTRFFLGAFYRHPVDVWTFFYWFSSLLGVDPGGEGNLQVGKDDFVQVVTSLQRPKEDPFFELFQIFGNQTSARLWWVLSKF